MRETGQIPEQAIAKPMESDRTAEVQKASIEKQLAQFNITYDSDRTLEQNQERFLVLKRMAGLGFLKVIDGKLVFDEENIRNRDTKSGYDLEKHGKGRKRMTGYMLIETLSGLKGYTLEDLETEKFKTGVLSPREVLPLPNDLNSMLKDYPQKAKNAIFNIWDINQNIDWIRPVKLKSGEITNPAELTIAEKLINDLKVKRNENGELEIFDKSTNKYEKFAVDRFSRLTGLRIKLTTDNEVGGFHQTPVLFAKKYLPNLIKNGFLQEEDFRRLSGTRSFEVFGSLKKFLDPKAPYKVISAGKTGARYYINRDKIVGTDVKVNPESMYIQALDPKTAGIIDERHGKKMLLYTLDLLDEEEIKSRREKVKQQMSAKGKQLREKEITAWVIVGGDEVKKRLHKYDVTKFLPKRSDESAEAYAERISQLSDIEFVTGNFRKFLQEANIGSHNLPWGEQLILARAMLEERNKKRLVDFAKKYGIEGLRSFLSFDLDRNMGQKVLNLGERMESSLAAKVFGKYSKIIDSVSEAGRSLQSLGALENQGDLIEKISENLMKKGKILLEDFSETYKEKSQNRTDILKTLETIKSEIVLFASTFKVLSVERQINLNEIKNTELMSKDSSELSNEEKEEIERIFIENRKGYSKSLLKQTLHELRGALDSKGKEFYLLRHEGDSVAFTRFDELPNGNLYGGSLNVRNEVRGSAIGSAMLKATLDKKAENRNIEGIVFSKNPMLKHYVNDFGLKIVGEIPNYKGTGELYYKLLRAKNQPELKRVA